MTPEPMSDAEIQREKQERNSRVADLYDELARAGKHGHYESLFRIVRIEVERAIAARDAQWREMLGEPVGGGLINDEWRHFYAIKDKP